MSLKLLSRSRRGVAHLESGAQYGPAAKAVLSLERSCPTVSMAPAPAVVWMAAGVVLNRESGPTPMERLRSFADRAGPS